MLTPLQKKIGAWAQLVSEHGIVGGAMAVLTRYQSWSAEEVNVLAAKTKKDLWNPRIHGIINLYVNSPQCFVFFSLLLCFFG